MHDFTFVFKILLTRSQSDVCMHLIQNSFCSDMCVRFAELERKLGEIDRARALYMHASQIADPRVSAGVLWQCT